MSERKTPCNTYKVEYTCNECGTGTMDASDSVVDTYPPKYQHVCTDCSHIAYYAMRYPQICYEPIKALQIDWDAFEKHVKEQAKMQLYKVERLETGLAELIVKAQAVLDRWDSPLWKDAEPTAVVIHNLRVVVEKLVMVEKLRGG